jgi:hypothetical protein
VEPPLCRSFGTFLSLQSNIPQCFEWLTAINAPHTRKGVTAVYAPWDKFDLRREMATVVERSLRETLDGEPAATKVAAA